MDIFGNENSLLEDLFFIPVLHPRFYPTSNIIVVLRLRPTNLALALPAGPVENRTPTVLMGILWVAGAAVLVHAPDDDRKIVKDATAIHRGRQIFHLAGQDFAVS